MNLVNIKLMICFLAITLFQVNLLSKDTSKFWIEDSYQDFRDGVFGDAGRDLYVTNQGVIKTVRRFDFNQDGFIDFLVNSSHNPVYSTDATLFEFAGNTMDKHIISRLPVEGSIAARQADLNKDGFMDLVFLPNRNGATPRSYLNIFWGGDDGWSNERKTGLVTMRPADIEIADLNSDGWLDIIVLNGSRWSPVDGPESVVRIYWGSSDTYMHYDATDIVVDRAVSMQAVDMNADGRPDLAILLKKPGEIKVYYNDAFDRDMDTALLEYSVVDVGVMDVSHFIISRPNNGSHPDVFVLGGKKTILRGNPTTGTAIFNHSNIFHLNKTADGNYQSEKSMAIPPSSGFTLYDLDSDGHRDLILMNGEKKENSLTIFWGNAKDGFDSSSVTAVPVEYVSAIACADFNSDGMTDIAAGIGRTDSTFEGGSFIIWGKGEREFAVSDIRVPTSHVGEVLYIKESGHILFCNGRMARLMEDVPVGIYWGTADGFDPEQYSSFDMQAGYAGAGADLNDDDYPDMIQLSIVHAYKGDQPFLGFNVFWGGKHGLQQDHYTNVHEYGVWGLEVVDIDGDGYLDLLSAKKRASLNSEELPGLVVWYGNKDGYHPENRELLPMKGGYNGNLTADYNKDGYLDVAMTSNKSSKISILWGSKDGLCVSNTTDWSFPSPADLETADLNADGWLDLLVTSHGLSPSVYWDYGTYIFWGSKEGFDPANAQRLPGDDGIGITVADWDADGHLDVLLPNYHLASTRTSVPAHLFWGSDSGFFNENRTDLMQDGGHDAMAVDFNQDGRLDLLIANHTGDGDHFTESTVYFNDGRRFKNPEIQFLPNVGPHYIYRGDIGNLYDRSYYQTYTSSVFVFDQTFKNGSLEYTAQIPEKCQLEFYVRSSSDKGGLNRENWIPLPDKTSKFDLQRQDRVIQYKAIFNSDNGDRYPELDKVSIELRQ